MAGHFSPSQLPGSLMTFLQGRLAIQLSMSFDNPRAHLRLRPLDYLGQIFGEMDRDTTSAQGKDRMEEQVSTAKGRRVKQQATTSGLSSLATWCLRSTRT